MDFKQLSKSGGLMITSLVVIAITLLIQFTQGALRMVVLAVGLVVVFLLFSFLLSRD